MKSKSPDFIYGLHAVEEAVAAGRPMNKVLIKKDLRSEAVTAIRQQLLAQGIPWQYVPQQKLDSVTRKNHQGMIAFTSPVPFQDIQEVIQATFEAGQMPLIIALDQVSDVRNFGAIARTALGAGVHALFIPDKGAAQINADAVKTSAGALMHLPVCRSAQFSQQLQYMKTAGLQLIGATGQASKTYYQADYTQPTALVLGSEEKGLSTPVLKKMDELITIPMHAGLESLNVSVATGILAFEAAKQRLIAST